MVTYERQALRDQFNSTLSKSNQGQRDHQAYLRGELAKVAKQIGHLLAAAERGDWTEEVQKRVGARKRERLQIETDIEGIEHKLKLGQTRVSDLVMRSMELFKEELRVRRDM